MLQPDPREPQRPGAETPARRATPAAAPRRPRWRSADLFGAAEEIEIEHGDAVYRMRITSMGKLILTK
ncbi:hemin uptake protein HemP [Rubrivivax gelatinosus]|uniref:Hemin uptake protein HemP n=1 Tax=Rubrivivax gelatinosus (strain NBRC 100245 / IL144) TaxID=983917 RepID=I0HLR0_RUBGI|nr:hemin uptake protein HemP [Rubrivivax gelatinosus]MBG6080571.1 hemin uptake protein HemP [Rubrivivax gelatinosus]BAL93947.1 hypothetical protein RGE_06020 [Rubrivivax gelatinosus IL144]